MNHPTPKHFLILFACLLLATLACNLPTGAATSAPRPTAISPPTALPSPTAIPRPTATPVMADLHILQILLRYDPARPLGNVEVTVCNWSESVSASFDVIVSVGSVQHRIAHPKAIQPGVCADVYDPQADFNTYGITAPGSITLQAEIAGMPSDPPEGNTFQTTLNVPFLEPPKTVPGSDDIPLRTEGPHEVLKNIAQFYSKAPLDYQYFATLSLIDMRLCAPKVAEYLGLPILELVSWSHEEATYPPPGAYANPPSEVTQVYDSMADFVGYTDFAVIWNDVRQNRCSAFIAAAHEFTHLYITLSSIPSVLDEGLAELTSQRLTAIEGWAFECREDGWYLRYPLTNGNTYEESQPYTNLSAEFNYFTAACFWDYIEKTYGHEKIQTVARRLNEVKEGDALCGTYFIRDILNPIVGEDVTPVTEPRFGVGLLMSNCK